MSDSTLLTPLSSISQVREIVLRTARDIRGSLCAVEPKDLPFVPRRSFWVHGVPERVERGKHAHYVTEQLLICLHGSVMVRCYDGQDWSAHLLTEPNRGLYIPAMIWDEEIYTAGSVLLAYASTPYSRADYIEDLRVFERMRRARRNDDLV